MSLQQEFRFPSSDGSTTLYGRSWAPEHCQPKAVVQIAHGISEHIGLYAPLAEFLTQQGYFVVGEDHLGHGNTPENPEDLGYTAPEGGWWKMVDNIRVLRERIGAQYPHLPYILLGHSMGSFLARSYLIRYPSTLSACIIMGTGQLLGPVLSAGILVCNIEKLRLGDHGRSPLVQSLCFGAYNSQFKPNRTRADWISSVEAEVDLYLADPFCQITPTVTLIRDMLKGIQFNQNKKNMAKMDMTIPLYFLSGENDPVGDNGKGVTKAVNSFKALGYRKIIKRLYPGGRHEIHNEANREQVFRDLAEWLDCVIA